MRDVLRLFVFLAAAFLCAALILITMMHYLTEWLYRRKMRRWPELTKLEAQAPTDEQWAAATAEEVVDWQAINADQAESGLPVDLHSEDGAVLFDQDADSETQAE